MLNHTLRFIRKFLPTTAIIENVPQIESTGALQLLINTLAEADYIAVVLPADLPRCQSEQVCPACCHHLVPAFIFFAGNAANATRNPEPKNQSKGIVEGSE